MVGGGRPKTYELVGLTALPRILPFGECPAAVPRVAEVVGTTLPDRRDEVVARLHSMRGCTHLNDELRALSEVPAMLAGQSACGNHEQSKRQAGGAGHRSGPGSGALAQAASGRAWV